MTVPSFSAGQVSAKLPVLKEISEAWVRCERTLQSDVREAFDCQGELSRWLGRDLGLNYVLRVTNSL